jgi:methionine-rich copper-binding protein CopC
MRRLLAALVLLILPGSIALASEPSEGEVSTSTPKVEWTGSTTNSYPNYVAMNQDPDGTPCQAPMCDTFALKVAAGGVDLVVRAHMENDGSTGPANTGVRITKPDGTKLWQTGPSGATAELKVTIKKAPAGDYVIDVLNNFVGQPQNFLASAELAVPAAAPAAPATATPPPSGQPAPAPETKLTVKPAKAMAGKKVKATVTSSAPVSGVAARLARGGKVVATGKLPSLNGTARVTLKAKKSLKPGKYLLTVNATDGQGRPVTGQAKITIRR